LALARSQCGQIGRQSTIWGRAARRYVFIPKLPILVYVFGRVIEWKMLGIVCTAIWYICPRFRMLHHEPTWSTNYPQFLHSKMLKSFTFAFIMAPFRSSKMVIINTAYVHTFMSV
jgi:hypothetical protein